MYRGVGQPKPPAIFNRRIELLFIHFCCLILIAVTGGSAKIRASAITCFHGRENFFLHPRQRRETATPGYNV